MPPKELELLYHLASTPNRVYTRNQLLDEVWGFDYFGDSRTVDVHVKRLREKLGDALAHVAVFHLRGSIRWQSLGLAERLMMKALVAGLKKKPQGERSETEQLLIETEDGALDFSDEADIASIVHAARFGKEAE